MLIILTLNEEKTQENVIISNGKLAVYTTYKRNEKLCFDKLPKAMLSLTWDNLM